MKLPSHIEQSFFEGERTAQVHFVVGDSVRVVEGKRAGAGGAVIAITAIEPEVEYLVEMGAEPFGDIRLLQSQLKLV